MCINKTCCENGVFFVNDLVSENKTHLGNDHLTWSPPYGYGFFLKKYSDSQCCWKKYSDFGGAKKNQSDSEILSYNLMLNCGKKFRALCDKKNKYSNSCVVRKKNFWTKQKTITPPTPLQVKWSVPYIWGIYESL